MIVVWWVPGGHAWVWELSIMDPERKARLKALREAAGAAYPQAPVEEAPGEVLATAPEDEGKEVKFRNYLPKDEALATAKQLAAQPEAFEEVRLVPVPGLDETVDVEDAIMTLAPKKANYDLKRDVHKKLEKLERRTQKAMAAMIQDAQAAEMEQEE